ncbi:hypothetical protein Fcan01_09236 [Folsomia candida]|uniref:Uncharacterized protein n=1 Tax=Folsomia candida TaxID=158441 RepID=A0A226EIE2_FOLCA|nr:hypothetical protein Fcan01_09236 [Folsomia candida]
MDRDHYKFRSKARIVAFLDLILSSMSLCICLIFFIALVRVTTMDQGMNTRRSGGQQSSSNNILEMDLHSGGSDSMMSLQKEGSGNIDGDANGSGGDDGGNSLSSQFGSRSSMFSPSDPAFLKLMWMFFALITIMTAVQILAAIRLLNATQLGKEPIGAMRLCRFWRFVCIFFTGLLVFNFLSAFRQRSSGKYIIYKYYKLLATVHNEEFFLDNFLEVSFLMTSILIRIGALYIVQQFVNELDVTIVTTLPIRRIHHPTSSHMPPSFPGGDSFAYAYGPQFAGGLSAQAQAPPPKYEDVVKEPYKPSGEA